MGVSPVLPTGRYHCGRPTALRDFSAVYVRFGSSATEEIEAVPRRMSASLQKRTSERLPCYVRLVPKAAVSNFLELYAQVRGCEFNLLRLRHRSLRAADQLNPDLLAPPS